MKKNLVHIIARSLIHYRKAVLIQIIIIAILAAVITGSLLTGFSVRESLRSTAFARMGNTSILISSGLRYFSPGLSDRLSAKTGQNSTEILETEGFCQNFSEGTSSGKIKIFGINSGFFRFNGNDTLKPEKGEVIINKRLSERIGVKAGDEIIIRIREISDIPSDAPFSTGDAGGTSIVMKIGHVLSSEEGGDFSLGISQIVPSNIFIRMDDLAGSSGQKVKPNRILSENRQEEKTSFFTGAMELTPADLGLKLRKTETGQYEFISSRIFIDRSIIQEIRKNIPDAAPLITYLANSISFKGKETPYSFVSGIPSEIYPVTGDGIVINQWLADDLGASAGDTVTMTWLAPDSVNQLREKSAMFSVLRVVGIDSIWGDRGLMPDFPGIAGTESCSEWDAGMELDLKKIRNKDEEYWTKYRGTPKAFISYDLGKDLWGSNYGPATAIRFPAEIPAKRIEESLKGTFDPAGSGFFVTDLRADALQAAKNSVDFGTLFISLGFFIIFSSALLLSLSVSSYFDNKKDHIASLHAMGFRNKRIRRILFAEISLIGIAGSLAGTIAGMLVNTIIIEALNTVWNEAVQTNTLSASSSAGTMVTGFISSLSLIFLLFAFKTSTFLKSLEKKKSGIYKIPSLKTNKILLIISALLTFTMLIFSVIVGKDLIAGWFASGILLFLTLVLSLRQYYITYLEPGKNRDAVSFSQRYYSINPSQAVTPAIFIAAGIFALFITSLNRMNFENLDNYPESGTGGYLLWAETSVPVDKDMTTEAGKKDYGLDDGQFQGLEIVQIERKEGDDASCLNLNHITSPPLLGVNPETFIKKGSFSFASAIKQTHAKNPWKMLEILHAPNTIYGIADQTVLEWGLKIKTGDTLIIRAENGMPLNIIIAAGLKSSVFQGNVLIGASNLKRFFPSVSGSSVFLIGGEPSLSGQYKQGFLERFGNYGITVEETSQRLSSFYRVTNTYLSVFTVLGALGMILGIFGLGFVLLKNYNIRAGEFALLNAIGFSTESIRRSLMKDLLIILVAGVVTGSLAGLVSTFPTLHEKSNVSVSPLVIMVISVFLSGLIILSASMIRIKGENLIHSLKKD